MLKPWVPHKWSYSPTLGKYICTGCKVATKEKRKDRCKGGNARVFHESHDTYTLAHETTGETLWFCDTCGLYTQVKMCGMANQCTGPRQQGTPAWYALTRMRNGQHPGLRRKVNPVLPAPWGRPVKGVHRVIGNPTKTPSDVSGSQPLAAVSVSITGTLPPPSPSVRSSEQQEPHAVDPEEDPFGPNGVYGFDMPEDEFGLDHDSFFGMEDHCTL